MQAIDKVTIFLPPIGHPGRMIAIMAPIGLDLSDIPGLKYSHQHLLKGVHLGEVYAVPKKKDNNTCIAALKSKFNCSEKRSQRY